MTSFKQKSRTPQPIPSLGRLWFVSPSHSVHKRKANMHFSLNCLINTTDDQHFSTALQLVYILFYVLFTTVKNLPVTERMGMYLKII
jgi:hypothetical protein